MATTFHGVAGFTWKPTHLYPLQGCLLCFVRGVGFFGSSNPSQDIKKTDKKHMTMFRCCYPPLRGGHAVLLSAKGGILLQM